MSKTSNITFAAMILCSTVAFAETVPTVQDDQKAVIGAEQKVEHDKVQLEQGKVALEVEKAQGDKIGTVVAKEEVKDDKAKLKSSKKHLKNEKEHLEEKKDIEKDLSKDLAK